MLQAFVSQRTMSNKCIWRFINQLCRIHLKIDLSTDLYKVQSYLHFLPKKNLMFLSKGVQALSGRILGTHAKHLAGWEAVHLTIRGIKIGLVNFLREGQYTMGHSCYGRHACCLFFKLNSWRLCPMSYKPYPLKGRNSNIGRPQYYRINLSHQNNFYYLLIYKPSFLQP